MGVESEPGKGSIFTIILPITNTEKTPFPTFPQGRRS